jgi:hypothetical protein
MLTADDVVKGAKQLKKARLKGTEEASERKRHKKPRLFDYIPKDKMIALFDNAMDLRIVDNNLKADKIIEIMGPGFKELGTGTNRTSLMKDGYVFKIALDRRGMIDNLAEYKRAAEVPNFLAKCYETNRVVAISEYVNLLSLQEYKENRDKIKIILSNLTSKYVIKDLGLTPKNYCNWGYRDDGSIVALDYAYMYPLEGSPDALKCSCGGKIELDGTFTNYTCNNRECALHYSPMEIINKMSLDAERMDDMAVFNEAGVDLEDAEVKFGDEFVNYVKISAPDDNQGDDDTMVKVSSEPINSSSLAEAMDKYKDIIKEALEDDDDSYIDLEDDENSDEIYKEEFLEALEAFDKKYSE